ncbi:hypothetical protein CXB51_024484 [Gossypium anomalum]|uniref:Wall-associated receptor kinase galacturonan-binding domain-containing protein n=1 Tax=Gossypium anomalum TaxID=47600 RepID=A0A8J6CS66_9ROSI|nr:hypothetical protein CXB51_024484 [Gossypium anomalum]
MGFHFILLLLFLFLLCPILQAAESQETACGEEVCGNVTIFSLFGINRSCYTKPWFRLTCKPTPNGEKPFININAIDLEVVQPAYVNLDTIVINNPVTHINCDHINEASVSVNLSGTPFFFSSEKNYYGSVGCGNLATILRNEADSLGDCVQPRCDDGASESGCFTQITGNFTSYTVNMTAMYLDSNRCASGFFFYKFLSPNAYPLPTGINIGTTHVPAALNWKSTYCGNEGCTIQIPIFGSTNINTYKVDSCGNVTFHYPFRMKDQDNSNDWFKVICNKTVNGEEVPFLNINGMNMQILGFDFLAPAFTSQITTTSSGLRVAVICSFFVNMSSKVDSSDYRRKRSCGYASLISDDYDLTFELVQTLLVHPMVNIVGRDGSLCLNIPSNYCLSESCPSNYEYNSMGFRCECKIQTQNTHSLKSLIVGM